VSAFTLRSDDLKSGKFTAEHILSKPYGFGCEGGNLSPHLAWDNPPESTKSFVLTMYDKDAPTGIGWMHWVVINIGANVREIARGDTPPGLQTQTDFGQPGYGGPCPPPGAPHRYIFTLYALDIDKMPVPEDASGALVGFNIGAHTIGKAAITAQYKR